MRVTISKKLKIALSTKTQAMAQRMFQVFLWQVFWFWLTFSQYSQQMTGAFFCMIMPVSLLFIFIMFDLRWFVPDAPSTFLRFICLVRFEFFEKKSLHFIEYFQCLLVLDPTQFCLVYITKTYGIYKARSNTNSLVIPNSDFEIDHGDNGSKTIWSNELFYE